MVVVDANVITGLILPGGSRVTIEKLRIEDPVWSAPALWRNELCNTLIKYERYAAEPRAKLLFAFKAAEEAIANREYQPAIEQVMECASRTGLSGYDATYVALAEDLNVPLYTYDKGILKACPEVARKP